jgi:hypothetical protein
LPITIAGSTFASIRKSDGTVAALRPATVQRGSPHGLPRLTWPSAGAARHADEARLVPLGMTSTRAASQAADRTKQAIDRWTTTTAMEKVKALPTLNKCVKKKDTDAVDLAAACSTSK